MAEDSVSEPTFWDEPRLVTGTADTSKAAAQSVDPKRGTQRYRVLAWLVAHGPAIEETVTTNAMIHVNAGRLRLAELKQQGYVECLEDVGLTRSGHKAHLWKATAKGHEYMAMERAA
jgi:predicted ArsR family transcriptional regulator